MKRISEEAGICVHHLISRVVQRRFLMGESEMEAFRHMLGTQADFCGIEVLTYCFLSNHFHLLVRIDPEDPSRADDAELLRRFSRLYGTKRSPSLGVDAPGLAAALAKGGERAEELRRRLRARMGKPAVFMRELKTRFTIWYNEQAQTVGTFWAERYRSVLIEEGSVAARLVAVYIDLNAVRAGLVRDPKDYRFCGFSEATGGAEGARNGIARIEGMPARATEALARYRQRILAQLPHEQRTGETPDDQNAHRPLSGKIRDFSEGAVLGSRKWVDRFCRKGGGLGFGKDRRPRDLGISNLEGTPEGVTAGRQWVR